LILTPLIVLALEAEAATQEGTAMVFGYLGGGPAPYEITGPRHSLIKGIRTLWFDSV